MVPMETSAMIQRSATQKGIKGILTRVASLMSKAQYEEARKALEEGITLAPLDKRIWEQMVACSIALKRPKDALSALDRILQIDPRSDRAWSDKAYLHLLLNEKHEGIEALKKSLKIEPRNQRKWLLLASAYMSLKNWR
ncbi:MAG: hypothetical protein DRO73_07370, partial [Candidatus Thorarchaeota archaeon]